LNLGEYYILTAQEVKRMQYIYKVQLDGEWVDLKELPEEQQKEIKQRLTDKVADALAEEYAKCP